MTFSVKTALSLPPIARRRDNPIQDGMGISASSATDQTGIESILTVLVVGLETVSS
jgi:hypothetical protein